MAGKPFLSWSKTLKANNTCIYYQIYLLWGKYATLYNLRALYVCTIRMCMFSNILGCLSIFPGGLKLVFGKTLLLALKLH